MAEPFIKLYKKMLKWEWYDDINTCRLFLHCLLRANWESGSWHGIDYKAGQFITSLGTLANETHLTVKQVRTALEHLKRTNEVADFRQGNYRIITIVKWNEYQSKGKPTGKETADQGQTEGRPRATDKEYIRIYKNDKDIKNIIPPTVEMVKKYCEERGNSVDPESFVSFYESKGWMIGKNKMKDWQSAVRTWEKSEKREVSPQKKMYKGRDYDFKKLEGEILGNV